ncbi:unnamed protein product [Angiostrongylus costaricensis]|uniref:Mitochondrial import inner membrane translocase subunit n=1 Tax=Angiostrongylus costaricensis TaxID=334426 RepID=A0A158PEM9_ANGCS|nr:unnamed protein product [Angiostrongylus costaricensis]
MAAPNAGDKDLKAFRDFLTQYNTVTEQCFGACVNDLTARLKEEKCSINCLDKYLKMTQRVSLRFQVSFSLLVAVKNSIPIFLRLLRFVILPL